MKSAEASRTLICRIQKLQILFNYELLNFQLQLMKKLFLALAVLSSVMTSTAKTLVVYYSFTNNVHSIMSELHTQIEADVIRIEPAEKGLDYAADNYAIGSALISTIRNNPEDASSYPAIDPVSVNLADYNCIIIGAPLWWSNMAAPLQTWLFHNGSQMAGKKIGLIVSSASSGISGVEADARRLVPYGDFLSPSLWIRSSQTSDCRSMLADWLEQINYNVISSGIESVYSGNAVDINITRDAIRVDGDFQSLALYNMSGNKVLESSENSISTSSLTPDVYVARLNADARSVSKKIIIK